MGGQHLNRTKGKNYATDLASIEGETRPQARVPRAHGHGQRPEGVEPPPREGAQESDGERSLKTTRQPSEGTGAGPEGEKSPEVREADGRAFRVHRGLGKKERLRHDGQFREAYGQGRSGRGRWVVAFLRRGEGASWRLGVVASRKVGNAVERARAKRRLREVFRLHREWLWEEALDMVLVARRGLGEAEWGALEADVREALRRARAASEGGGGRGR